MMGIMCFAATDWSQFWPGMIATFVGFVLALFGQFCWEKGKDVINAKHLLKRIKAELEEIKGELNDIGDNSIEAQPLKTLVWDEAINTGMISLLSDDKRKMLFGIYKQIQEFNSWFTIKTEYFFSHGNHNKDLCEELADQKGILLGSEQKEGKTSIDNVIAGIGK